MLWFAWLKAEFNCSTFTFFLIIINVWLLVGRDAGGVDVLWGRTERQSWKRGKQKKANERERETAVRLQMRLISSRRGVREGLSLGVQCGMVRCLWCGTFSSAFTPVCVCMGGGVPVCAYGHLLSTCLMWMPLCRVCVFPPTHTHHNCSKVHAKPTACWREGWGLPLKERN